MFKTFLFKNATIVNEGKSFTGDVLVKNGFIEKIGTSISVYSNVVEIDATDKWLIPGIIDDQVHFREPGLTHKATIATEARAAVAGGITTFMEMPNTNPPAITQELLEDKYNIAAASSIANFSFFMGVTNKNINEVLKTNEKLNEVCGIKIFMGSSTGDMLVDNSATLNEIFAKTAHLIATHCEDEAVIARNKEKYPNPTDASFHPLIRDVEACYQCSSKAINLATKYNTRLHILHITTARELDLFTNKIPLANKRITNEVCVHHLHFTTNDYAEKGNLIKCNPAIKAPENRTALWEALLDDRLDIIATDHAPHTWEEKQKPYEQAPAGLPLVQHALQIMLQYVEEGKISIEKVVEKMCHAPAVCFQISNRGYIREGYHADLVLVSKNTYTVEQSNILYKCGWSPFEDKQFSYSIDKTMVNGNIVFEDGILKDTIMGQRVLFNR
ncbi:MAG TPA: dihydroorotase [Edaphocola sp.]|nr:dihydroorotase [Edaphocola sp.]